MKNDVQLNPILPEFKRIDIILLIYKALCFTYLRKNFNHFSRLVCFFYRRYEVLPLLCPINRTSSSSCVFMLFLSEVFLFKKKQYANIHENLII